MKDRKVGGEICQIAKGRDHEELCEAFGHTCNGNGKPFQGFKHGITWLVLSEDHFSC